MARFNGIPVDEEPPKTGGRFGGVPVDEESDDFSFSEMVSNIPESAAEFGKNIIQPILNPIDTATTIGKLVTGGAQKLNQGMEGYQPSVKGIPVQTGNQADYTPYADAMGKFMSERYGGMDNIKRTVESDPVGSVADLATALTLGGVGASRLPGMAGQVGRNVGKVGQSIEPVNMLKVPARTAGKGLASLVPRSTPRSMYESSAKFSTTFPEQRRAAMAETALKHGLMPTQKGVDKLGRLMGDLDARITSLISDATERGVTIPKDAIYRHLREVRSQLGAPTLEGQTNLRQINRVAKRFDEHMKSLGKDSLTPDELQSFKRDAYREINFDVKQGKARRGTNEARKAMARAAKESVEDVAPVRDLNRQYGEFVDLAEPLQRSASRIDNRNLVGIDTPLNIGAGGAAGGPAGVALGAGVSILEYPKVKAALAIKIRQLQDRGWSEAAIQKELPTLIQEAAFQAGRAEEELN